VLATGFIDTSDESGTQIYLLTPSPEAWSQLQKVKTQVEQAVEQAKRTTMAPPSPSNINGFGEMGGNMGGFSGMGGMPQNPAAAAAAADLMRNPQALQGMLQVCMQYFSLATGRFVRLLAHSRHYLEPNVPTNDSKQSLHSTKYAANHAIASTKSSNDESSHSNDE
jgi:hypothetical protein